MHDTMPDILTNVIKAVTAGEGSSGKGKEPAKLLRRKMRLSSVKTKVIRKFARKEPRSATMRTLSGVIHRSFVEPRMASQHMNG